MGRGFSASEASMPGHWLKPLLKGCGILTPDEANAVVSVPSSANGRKTEKERAPSYPRRRLGLTPGGSLPRSAVVRLRGVVLALFLLADALDRDHPLAFRRIEDDDALGG